ncbi:USP34_6 [Blepharisma stoltei]|uniref:ubiquitinyl hydrolase 1 n=1 Tax=Blepharisma stoltei TaxID=1481888 RepID=A0AAU9JA56_9CILI|nr:unnamed protein product [Blepharisma stoltei]
MESNSTNINQAFKPGVFIDAKDTMNAWCVARIIEFYPERNAILIRYDGWSEKWDATYSLSSSRISPFRKNSQLYTGQKKFAIRSWEYSEEELERVNSILITLIQSGLKASDAFTTTQFIRGEVFTLVDCLLTGSFKTKAEIHASLEFFTHVIDYIVLWFQGYKEMFPLYYNGLDNPELFLTDNGVAAAMAWPELLLTLERLLGFDPRLPRIKTSTYTPKEFKPSNFVNKTSPSSTIVYLVDHFAESGGFDLILEILSEKDEKQKAPFSFITALPLYEINQFLSKQFSDDWCPKFKRVVLERISTISNRELKDIDKDVISEILQKLRKLSGEVDRRGETYEFIERAELELALKLLKCPYMEKRLRGLNEIKDMIEKVNNKGVYYQGFTKGTRWITTEFMKEWLLQENIIEIVLDYNHVEMIKRVSEIFIFLAKTGALTEDQLTLLWNSGQGRHDSLVIATLQAIVDITPFLSPSFHQFLFEKMKQKPIQEYDEMYLKMLKEFTLKAIEFGPRTRSDNDDFAIPIFYSLILDSSPINFIDIATDNLAEILKNIPWKDKLWQILLQLIKNIEENHSTFQSLKLAILILESFCAYKVSSNKDENLKLLDERVGGLIQRVVENLEKYYEIAREKAKGLQNPYREVLQGRYTHNKNIKKRFEFIEYVLSSRSFAFSRAHFSIVWEIFVKNPLSDRDKAAFFKWLQRIIRNIFTTKMIAEAFEVFFVDPLAFPRETISIEAYQCFCQFFLALNHNERNIEIRGNSLLSRNQATLIGFDAIMDILLKSKEEVSSQAIYFVVNLNLRLGRLLKPRKEEIWTSFINQSLSYIENSQSDLTTERVLKLLLCFLDDSGHREESPSGPIQVFYAKTMQENEYKKIHAYSNQTVGSLRRKISELYKKPLNTVLLTLSGIRYDSYDDDMPISSIKTSVISIDFLQPKSDEITQVQLLSKHQKLVDVLFQLLSVPDKAFAGLAWNLLTALPINEKIKIQIKELEQTLPELLDSSSLYKLLYTLIIIEQLISDEEWMQKFQKAGGLPYLIDIYLNTDTSNIKSISLNSRYCSVMISLLSLIFKETSSEPSPQLILKIFQSLMIIASACKSSEEEASKVAVHATEMLLLIGNWNESLLVNTVKKCEQLESLIRVSILSCPNTFFGASMMTLFDKLANLSEELSTHILDIHIKLINTAYEENASDFYWALLSHLLKRNNDKEKKTPLVQRLLLELQEKKPEKSSKEHDHVLWGTLRVIRSGIRKSNIKITKEIVHLILHSCLFEVPSSSQLDPPPKCKNSDTRKEAFRLLYKLCVISRDALYQVVEYLNKLHEDPHWRTSRFADWNYSPVALEKSETGFVGLKNLGCICYMNSSIQQMFNVPTFREGILRAKDLSGQNLDESLLYQLQYIFSGLKNSDKQHINPKGLCRAFKDWEGRPVNVFEQMDAEEFFNTFMDRLENQLKGDPNEHIIKNHFGGFQVTEMFGKDTCNHRSERLEPFLTFPVQVKNKKNLYESLDSFIEGELLEGDNMYQCDHCDNKVPALRRVCIKYLPNTFIISLRRFEFDFDTMARVKVNDYCEFPMEIDMEPYTQEGLERKELLKLKEQAIKEGKEFTKEIPNKKYPEEYYKFTLKGIVIHMGTAESGHYYSFIKDRSSGKWNEFNDTIVRPFNPEDIPNEAFGGEEKWSFSSSYSSNSTTNREKYRNAYLLFYEREKFYSKQSNEDDTIIPLTTITSQGEVKDFEEVKEENERYWRCKSSFSTDYFDFITRLLKYGKNEILKFAASFFLTIMIRSKDVTRLPIFVNLLKNQLKENEEISEWVLETVTVPQVLKELLLDCPVVEKRRVIVGVIHAALKTVNPYLHEQFLQRLLNKLSIAKSPYSRHFPQYFEVIYRTVQMSPHLMPSTQLIAKLTAYVLSEKIDFPLYEERYKFSDIYLGYDKHATTDESHDKFSSHDDNNSLSYVLAILNFGSQYLSSELVSTFWQKSIVSKLSSSCTNKIGCRSVGEFYAKFCSQNRVLSENYVDVLIQHISDNDYDFQRPFLRQLTCLLKIQDDLTDDRVDYGLRSLLTEMKENKQYYKTTELCIEYFFKTVLRIPAAKEWAYKKVKDFKWIEAWLKDNQFPTAPSGMKPTMSLYKPNSTQWGATSAYISKNNTEKLEFYKKILKGTVAPAMDDWDSDEDMKDEDLQVDKKIDALENNGQRWCRATIVNNVGELLQIRLDNAEKTSKWVEVDGDLIAPEGSKTSY